MAWELKLTRLAEEDFESILQETFERWGPDQYFVYEKKLLKGFAAIADDPNCLLSKARGDLHKGARPYPVARHYLLYVIAGETVVVERILYQGMDLPRHVGDCL